MNSFSVAAGIAYLIAYEIAVYDRVPINEWLASHLLAP